DFINCVVWRAAAENLANYMSKGQQVGVDGRLPSIRHDDKDGKTVFVTEVVAESDQILEPKNSNKQGGDNRTKKDTPYNYQNNTKNQASSNQTEGETIDISGDDLPF